MMKANRRFHRMEAAWPQNITVSAAERSRRRRYGVWSVRLVGAETRRLQEIRVYLLGRRGRCLFHRLRWVELRGLRA